MTVVVDTNVIAYFVLQTTPFWQDVEAFWDLQPEAVAPSHWEAEFANVVWTVVKAGVLDAEEGSRRLDMASRLGIRSVAIGSLWQGALQRSIESRVAVYDTLFVELAAQRDIKFATFDAELIKGFPDVAVRPRALTSAQGD
jgi:predicted nucleic acid-binding protein